MFDITKHEWYDSGILEVYEDEPNLSLSFDYDTPSLTLNKDDAIAIARHFGLIEKPVDSFDALADQVELSILKKVMNKSPAIIKRIEELNHE